MGDDEPETLEDIDLDGDFLDDLDSVAESEPAEEPSDLDADEFWYPTVGDIVAIHDVVIEEDEESEPGVRNPEQLEFPVSYIKEGYFGEVPETIHEKAFHLMRLLAANHYFVDGNKRTALNTTSMFYLMNGHDFESGKDIRALLKLFSVREEIIDREVGAEYFSERIHPFDADSEIEGWESLVVLLDAASNWLVGERLHLGEEVDVEELSEDEGKGY